MAVPDGVDELAGDHGQGVEELADEDAVRGQPRRVSGHTASRSSSCMRKCTSTTRSAWPVDGDPSYTQPLEVRPPRAAVRAVQLDHRGAGAEVLSLDDSLGRGGRVPQHRLRLHRAGLFRRRRLTRSELDQQAVTADSQLERVCAVARRVVGDQGKASDAGTSPRWTTGSTNEERQARHTSPSGPVPTVTWPPSHAALSDRVSSREYPTEAHLPLQSWPQNLNPTRDPRRVWSPYARPVMPPVWSTPDDDLRRPRDVATLRGFSHRRRTRRR